MQSMAEILNEFNNFQKLVVQHYNDTPSITTAHNFYEDIKTSLREGK